MKALWSYLKRIAPLVATLSATLLGIRGIILSFEDELGKAIGFGLLYLVVVCCLLFVALSRRAALVSVGKKHFTYSFAMRLWAVAGLVIVGVPPFVVALLDRTSERPEGKHIGRVVVGVRPLETFGSLPNDWLASGISSELVSQLALVSALDIRSGGVGGLDTSNVDVLVEGSVGRSGEDVRVVIQLIDTKQKKIIWAQTYAMSFAHLTRVQNLIVRETAQQVNVRLSRQDEARLARRAGHANPDALEDYWRGRFKLLKRTPRDIVAASRLFSAAVQRDTTNALAYAALSEAEVLKAVYDVVIPDSAFAVAHAAAQRALAIDDQLAEAHAAWGSVLWLYQWRWQEAEQSFRRAIELDPRFASAHHYLGWLLSLRGAPREALVELQIARTVDPFSPIIRADYAQALLRSGDRRGADQELREMIQLDPDFAMTHVFLGRLALEGGDYAASIRWLTRAQRLASRRVDSWLGIAYARAGRRIRVEAIARALTEQQRTHYVPNVELARLYCALGDIQAAERSLLAALARREPALTRMQQDASLECLRLRPAHSEALRRIQGTTATALPT